MTREEFIQVLEGKRYSYKIEWDKIVVTHREYVDLNPLKTIPSGVVFKNGGSVFLDELQDLPPGVEFTNSGYIGLNSLKTLLPGVKFENRQDVGLDSLKVLPPGVEFRNGGDVSLKSLGIRGGLNFWRLNIKGVDPKKLLNKMIEDGAFDMK